MAKRKRSSTSRKSRAAADAARTLSELGAAKGGRARAAKLTRRQRSAAARHAARARWARPPEL